MTSELLIEQHDTVRFMRLHRPDKRNALNLPLVRALLDAYAEADADEGTRAVVLAASGAAFCAGGDRDESQGLPVKDLVRRNDWLAELFGMPSRMRKPVLSVVRGPAVGGGAALALSADLTLLGASAVFSFPEVRQGIPPALVLPGLVRLAGARDAFFLMATGEPVLAQRAVALGLANAVHEDEAVEAQALALAQRLSAATPLAMGTAKQLFYQVWEAGLADGLEAGREVNHRLLAQMKRG